MSANNKKHNKLKRLDLILRLVTALIGLHALILGVLSWFFTHYLFTMLHLPILGDYPLWPKQSGAMHVSLAFAYGLGAIAPRYIDASIRVIILSKSMAILFLFPAFFMHGASIFFLLAGMVDLSILITIGAIAWGVYRCKNGQIQTVKE
jgi:hypothetical protein